MLASRGVTGASPKAMRGLIASVQTSLQLHNGKIVEAIIPRLLPLCTLSAVWPFIRDRTSCPQEGRMFRPPGLRLPTLATCDRLSLNSILNIDAARNVLQIESLSTQEAPMSKYIMVANRPNRIATIHLANCAHLGSEPLIQTTSADRVEFEDGLEALAAARSAMPRNFVFCGHCLPRFRWLRTNSDSSFGEFTRSARKGTSTQQG